MAPGTCQGERRVVVGVSLRVQVHDRHAGLVRRGVASGVAVAGDVVAGVATVVQEGSLLLHHSSLLLLLEDLLLLLLLLLLLE